MMMFVLFIPVLFAIGAIVLDVGNWYIHKRHLQTQVDAAVLASAPAFVGCFQDQATANSAVASTALGYAGDTLRDPTTVNQQLAVPGKVRVVLNADRYWQTSDGTASPSTGYGLDWGANNPAKMPCASSSIDAKATDEHVTPLWGLLPLSPSPKTHAKVEIHRVREANGFLPIAVPEIDPNFVYAIFVDYAKDGTQQPLAVQKLAKAPGYGGAGFLYSAWETDTSISNNASVPIHPNNTYSDGTGVVILVSKADLGNPPNVSLSQTLNQMCTQAPSDLVACYSGQGQGNNDPSYNGAATGQGLAFIHSHATSNGSPTAPLLLDVNLTGTICTGGMSPGNQSSPYFVNDDSDCTVGVTATVDFGIPTTPANGDPTVKPSQGGYCASVGSLTWSSTNGNITTWTGTMSVPVASGPQVLTLNWSDKTSGTSCSGGNSGSFGPATMAYSLDDVAGPVGYMSVTSASGPNVTTSCPQGSSAADPHSVARGNSCVIVDVGLTKPLAVQPWNFPTLVLRFASKSARKNGQGTANLNGSLLCDSGQTLAQSFANGCQTTYGLNYDKWGSTITPPCAAGAYCWKDVRCTAYPPNSLPPASTVNIPPPICIAAKNGQVQAFQAGVYDRFENPTNGYGGCTPNYWPTTQAEADQFFKPVDKGGHDFTNDPRYVTLIVTDNTAFNSSNTAEPVKYFAGFYVTGWDTDNGNGKPKGCYGFPPSANTCGAPNNDRHPLLGCLAGQTVSTDNGDLWGHFVKFVAFSATATPSDDLCALTSTSPDACVAVLVE
jgi:hypothetical protein